MVQQVHPISETLAREANRAYAIALRVVRVPELAEEAVQDAYVKLLKRPPAANHTQAALYLFIAVRHSAIALLKSERQRKIREESHAVIRPYTGSAENADRGELKNAASRELEELPTEEREAISLCYAIGLSQVEAAQVLSVPRRTLASRVQRGLDKLRGKLSAQGFAAVTPLMIAEGIRGSGLPQAPATLQASIQQIIAEAPTTLHSAAQSTRRMLTSGGKSSSGLVAASLTVVLGAGVLFALANQSTPAPAPKAAAPATPVTAPAPKIEPAPADPQPLPERPRINQVWSMDDGEPKGFEMLNGGWEFARDARGKKGHMSISKGQQLITKLPFRLSHHPLRLEVRVDSFGLHFGVLARIVEGAKILEHVYYSPIQVPSHGKQTFVIWFVDGKAITFNDGDLYSMCSYEVAFPSQEISLTINSGKIEWMSAREVSAIDVPTEVHQAAKDAEKLRSYKMNALDFSRSNDDQAGNGERLEQ